MQSLVLSSAGAVLGLALAYAALHALAQSKSVALPLLSSITVNGAGVVWTMLIAAVTALIVGLAPALKMTGPNLQEALKGTGSGQARVKSMNAFGRRW